eukprot:scaffold2083_cov419-Prasinococcus_capsulatus_cf.AAC.14
MSESKDGDSRLWVNVFAVVVLLTAQTMMSVSNKMLLNMMHYPISFTMLHMVMSSLVTRVRTAAVGFGLLVACGRLILICAIHAGADRQSHSTAADGLVHGPSAEGRVTGRTFHHLCRGRQLWHPDLYYRVCANPRGDGTDPLCSHHLPVTG